MEAAQKRDAHAHHGDGMRHLDAGRLTLAAGAFARAIELAPRWAEPMTALGNVSRALGRPRDAVQLHRAALNLAPDSAPIWSNLALAHKADGDDAEAIACLRRAAALAPDSAEIRFNLGNAWAAQGRPDDAASAFETALALDPAHNRARIHLGTALKDCGQVEDAITCLRAAVAREPGNADAEWNLALALLLAGHFAEGWSAYEARKRLPRFAIRKPAGPEWLGEPMAGETLLIHAEQGLGDTIQFVRFARFAAQARARIVVGVPRAMIRLIDCVHGLDDVVDLARDDLAYARQIAMLSLPRLAEGWGGATEAPYIYADQARIRAWGERLGPREGLRIGLCWQGNPAYAADSRRSMPLSLFAPLAAIPGVRIHGLHKGPGQAQIQEFVPRGTITDLGAELDRKGHAFLDTAAVMSHLDLVISTDTAIAHLAGALGHPTWLLLPHVADWRWGIGSDTTPWYPTMRIFRQETPGDWTGTIARLCAALATYTPKDTRP